MLVISGHTRMVQPDVQYQDKPGIKMIHSLPKTAEIFIPRTDPHRDAISKQALSNWLQIWNEQIYLSFVTISNNPPGTTDQQPHRILVVVTSQESLADLPDAARYTIIPPLDPVQGIIATAKNALYAMQNVTIRGGEHFAAGSDVYPHRQISSDGYARTYVTGRHRETRNYITAVQLTRRFENWRSGLIYDPIVVYELRYKGNGWTGNPEEQQEIDALVRIMRKRK